MIPPLTFPIGEARDVSAQRFRDWFDRIIEDDLRRFQTDVLVNHAEELDDDDEDDASGPWRKVTLNNLSTIVAEKREAAHKKRDAVIAEFFSTPGEPTH
jgi:hypothetical protein